MDLTEMGHPQPPTPVATDNTAANIIVDGTTPQEGYRQIDMIFYLVIYRIQQKHFHIFWEERKKT